MLKPECPEVVNHEEYERIRTTPVPRLSLAQNQEQTARLRVAKPTFKQFALDCPSTLLEVEHQTDYSIVRFNYRNYRSVQVTKFGVALSGIIFSLKSFPEDLDNIPYSSERGYFKRTTADSHDGLEVAEEAGDYEPQEISYERLTELALR